MTYSAYCTMTECPMKDECIRHSFYLKALNESESFTIMNPTRITCGPEGCEHRLTTRKVHVAYGFKRLAATIPQGNFHHMDWGIHFGSESSYYRAKRGERAFYPDEQRIILAHAKAAGGNPDVGFDRYADVTEYVEVGKDSSTSALE